MSLSSSPRLITLDPSEIQSAAGEEGIVISLEEASQIAESMYTDIVSDLYGDYRQRAEELLSNKASRVMTPRP